MMDIEYEDMGEGAFFYDFYFDKNGYLFKHEGIEGIMINTVEDLYLAHSLYHKKISETKYVPAGSIIGCTYGSILAKLSGKEATGVYVGNGAPAMTCADCNSGDNIPTFGTCTCPEAARSGMPNRRTGTYGSANGLSGGNFSPKGYKCIPLISEDWKQPGKDRVLIWRPSSGGKYYCALKDNAILVCLYGGTIGVVQVDTLKYLEEGISNRQYVENTVWKFFKDQQFTDEQVAGIMGNAMQESTFNPLRRRQGGQYWGLFQIKKEDSLQLESRYKEAGIDISAYGYNARKYQEIGGEASIPREDLEMILDIQLDFAYTYDPSGHKWVSKLRTANSVEEAAENFLVNFEGATIDKNDPEHQLLYYKGSSRNFQHAKSRREYARTYYNKYSGGN